VIAIFTQSSTDITVVHLTGILQERGVAHVVLDPATIEGQSAFAIEKDSAGRVRCYLRLPDRVLDLDEIHSAWVWRGWQRYEHEPGLAELAARPREWAFYKAEWIAFYRGLTLTLAHHGVFCVNPPPFHTAFEEKCCQLYLAAKLGLDIPPTLYTTRPSLARKLADAAGGSIIYKPFHAYAHVIEATGEQPLRTSILYTNRVDPDQLVETDDDIPTPSIFQPYVEKAYELRIVVVGRQLFACAIHSQQSERSREDWRRYDLENTPYVSHELPASIREKLLALMDAMGLVFGSIDMIVTPEGDYIFLEVNPNGQFDWVAKRAGLPIYEALVDLLIAGEVRDPASRGGGVRARVLRPRRRSALSSRVASRRSGP
jgi:glutathione synthase/RimK-type ligase-like ATP-grasp enzyme